MDQLDVLIERALAEDIGSGDITTDTLIGSDWQGKATLLVKAEGVLAGIEVAKRVFQHVDPAVSVKILIQDGSHIKPGDITAAVVGYYAAILRAERTMLNILQRLSGIATETARYVAAVQGLPARILDTRKTPPGLRVLDKYAVRMGGGQNHRMGLDDGVLIKDNHLAVLRQRGMQLREIINKARLATSAHLKVEVEVRSPDEAREAADAGADIIMLDNMDIAAMREAVRMVHKRALVEASGGITLANVRLVAETGVDFISVGALTHSVNALDISLEFEEP